MNLQNLNYTGLMEEEAKSVNGKAYEVFAVQYRMFKFLWNNKKNSICKRFILQGRMYSM